ncbi:hypothetical protein [Sphingobacterium kitahiroshimense]|uniref:Uncharacterized protein n=1 Tax=Sphingobacterium kitahiroshimense TaxID=470446 RepID=A0ABV0BW42_9SPHI
MTTTEDINIKGDLGEEIVNKLAFDTYLKYWCCPGPKDEKGSKKEICDLLILFREVAIIISVKNYAFKGNYDRYFRLTLDKAVSQIAGAERKLFSGEKVYIKHVDLNEELFDSLKYTTVLRIIVNHNTEPLFYPAGRLTVNGKYIHIFNWNAFLGIVTELDTIPDFINYLLEREIILKDKDAILMIGEENDWTSDVKESFFKYNEIRKNTTDRYLLISGNELDLLADYFWNTRKFNKLFYSNEYESRSIKIDSKWRKYLLQKEVQNKKAADADSYFIDEFIKHEVLYNTKTYNLEIATELLSLSRFERRILGHEFLQLAKQYQNKNDLFSARRYGQVNDLLVAMVLYTDGMSHNVVMELIRIAAEGYIVMNKYRNKKVLVVGFSNKLRGFKYGFLKNINQFDKEYEDTVINDLKMLKWFTNVNVFQVTHKEYPE